MRWGGEGEGEERREGVGEVEWGEVGKITHKTQ